MLVSGYTPSIPQSYLNESCLPYLLAKGLSHISWAEVTSNPCNSELEKVTSTGQKSHQNIKIPMAHRLSRNVVISPKMKKTLRTLRDSHMFKLCFQIVPIMIPQAWLTQTKPISSRPPVDCYFYISHVGSFWYLIYSYPPYISSIWVNYNISLT